MKYESKKPRCGQHWRIMTKIKAARVFSIQTAGTVGLPTGIPMGSGIAKDALTESDAAAICAGGLRRKHYLAARLRWCMDASTCTELSCFLHVEIAGTAARERWTLSTGVPVMKALADLAVMEMLDPVTYGQDAYRLKSFGDSIDLPINRIYPAWTRTWRGRYQEAAWMPLERWSEIAASHIAYRQREPQDDV
jgi:hypothetical protein